MNGGREDRIDERSVDRWEGRQSNGRTNQRANDRRTDGQKSNWLDDNAHPPHLDPNYGIDFEVDEQKIFCAIRKRPSRTKESQLELANFRCWQEDRQAKRPSSTDRPVRLPARLPARRPDPSEEAVNAAAAAYNNNNSPIIIVVFEMVYEGGKKRL